jgi:acyl-CoA reductase-like NAD-dependent aldehyde dehydrogenase
MSTERIVVQRAVADQFRQALTRAAETEFGSSVDAPFLVSSTPVEKVRKLVSDAVSKGASVLFGDADARESAAASYRPLIVENVTKEMDLYATESFGPTVSLYVVDTEEEAVALANDTEYGLTSAVFTEDLRRGLRVAKQIESG